MITRLQFHVYTLSQHHVPAVPCYWETRSNIKGQHAPTQNKDKNIYGRGEKTRLLLRILAVISK